MVPDENEPEHGNKIWACARESRAAWHVKNSKAHPDVNGGKKYSNYWSLGVEVVNAQGADPFSQWQIEQTAALVRYAWSKYPSLVDIVSHAKLDPERRSDPGQRFPWDRFRDLVLTPAAPVHNTPFIPVGPMRVLGPDGQEIDCDPHIEDGVTVVEARPLLEGLGFVVEYTDEPSRTLQVRRRT